MDAFSIHRWSTRASSSTFFLLASHAFFISVPLGGARTKLRARAQRKKKKSRDGTLSLSRFLFPSSTERAKMKRLHSLSHCSTFVGFVGSKTRILALLLSSSFFLRYACRRDRPARQRHGLCVVEATLSEGSSGSIAAPPKADASIFFISRRRLFRSPTTFVDQSPRRPRLGLLRLAVQFAFQGMGLDPHRWQADGRETSRGLCARSGERCSKPT